MIAIVLVIGAISIRMLFRVFDQSLLNEAPGSGIDPDQVESTLKVINIQVYRIAVIHITSMKEHSSCQGVNSYFHLVLRCCNRLNG